MGEGALNHAMPYHETHPVSDHQPQDMLEECDDSSSPETTIAEIRAIIRERATTRPPQTRGTGS